ncbi:MAG: hypothetical protein COY66_02035 [Candidatus Kerfeldbacteria bacterium CG_4_10_14_0_8_um_filter_42_10]|uniref:ABC-2 type transporter transmembrane domain-containing protein n=1 Tax=Candidatus Kerfeldbacteria bacterium CG_4_10_14_0_8_um_filter_42_10 TaxID=2014248 RepID=A0A2M7RJJ2_9BACT|nr:MAG: hypothetical protein COY66_02035 [Candidatus Kerfeldbacteria bacterium CG_4_10_14_0_8_um_filter_42_10]
MKSKILLVAKKEYLKVVQKPSFWIMIIIIPVVYLILVAISGTSASSVEKKVAEEVKNVHAVLIVDQAGLISDQLLLGIYQRSENKETAVAQVESGKVDAAFVYPTDFQESKKIEVYAQDTSLISRGRFNTVAQDLLKQSLLQEIEDPNKVALFNSRLEVSSTLYKEGKVVDQRFETFIIPIASVLVYFLLVMFSSGFMLSSVSEEKENRMIETVLSVINPRQLIWGKLIGLTFVSLTSLAVLGVLLTGIIAVSTNIFPIKIDWSAVDWNIGQVLLALFYTIGGFLFMSSIMVGVGAAMPKYREAQQFSSVFIILSILPIYFASILIAEPTGTIARVISFTPFTAPLILIFRSSIGALSLWESILGIMVIITYVAVGFYLAFKLFEIGSLELSKRISFNTVFKKENKT